MNSPRDLIGMMLQSKLMVTDLIGEGAMGIVYRGFDAERLTPVAIKVLQPELAVHPELVARFYREGAAARRVDHKNTVRILGKGEDAGVHFLVMELLDGRSLGALLDVERRINQVRAANMMLEMCDALVVAHERGIIHRDLKPDNVMVSGKPGDALGEHVKLVDFGIAKRVGAVTGLPRLEDSFNNSDELTACGALVGTPEYMAPEQCRGLEVDARTDVYACGVMLYRMVTGEVPFTGDHPLEICQRHIDEAPRPPSAVMPGVHRAIEAVISKAMSKDPRDRHESAAALREDVARALATMAAEEGEATGTMVREEVVDALASTISMRRPPTHPPVVVVRRAAEEPGAARVERAAQVEPVATAQVVAPVAEPLRGARHGARERAHAFAVSVAFSAGMASILVMLGALLHH